MQIHPGIHNSSITNEGIEVKIIYSILDAQCICALLFYYFFSIGFFGAPNIIHISYPPICSFSVCEVEH